MRHESAKLLTDALEAAEGITQYTAGASLREFETNHQLRDAVYWRFAVLGEALASLRRMDEKRQSRFPSIEGSSGSETRLFMGIP